MTTCRSAHPSGARIETSMRAKASSGPRVAPLTRAERGLKLRRKCRIRKRIRRSAHPSGARIETRAEMIRSSSRRVAPLTRAERGLKQTERAWASVLRGRSAHPSGARIETAGQSPALAVAEGSLRSPERSAD